MTTRRSSSPSTPARRRWRARSRPSWRRLERLAGDVAARWRLHAEGHAGRCRRQQRHHHAGVQRRRDRAADRGEVGRELHPGRARRATVLVQRPGRRRRPATAPTGWTRPRPERSAYTVTARDTLGNAVERDVRLLRRRCRRRSAPGAARAGDRRHDPPGSHPPQFVSARPSSAAARRPGARSPSPASPPTARAQGDARPDGQARRRRRRDAFSVRLACRASKPRHLDADALDPRRQAGEDDGQAASALAPAHIAAYSLGARPTTALKSLMKCAWSK